MARRDVNAGQRYQPTDSNAVWEVLEMVKDAEGIGHARLIKVSDPTVIKMISISALKDSRLYRLLPAQEETV